MPTVWVTGVAGFTGRHLVRFLREREGSIRLVGIDRSERVPPDLDAYYRADLTAAERVAEIARQDTPSMVIHLAGVMPPSSDAEMWFLNVGGTVSLLSGLSDLHTKDIRILSIGSAAEYLPSKNGYMTEEGPCGGLTTYGRTKWAQTTLALESGKQAGLSVVIARPFNLIGPGLPAKLVAGALCAQFALEDQKDIHVGNTQSERDFLDVRDAVAAYWEIVRKGTPGEVYNVCSGTSTSISALVETFGSLTHRPFRLVFDTSRTKKVDLDRVYGSMAKIHAATGWRPKIALKQSLADMLDAAGR